MIRWASFKYDPRGRGGGRGWFKGFDLFGRRWGFDRSTVYVEKEKYLDRWILYVNGYTLRLHKFYRGDDDRASHTHPWWFITFPLSDYVENIYCAGGFVDWRIVRRLRFHFRDRHFEHYVVQKALPDGPWWTIVLTGPKNNTWGFYPKPGEFVHWSKWT